MSSAAHDKPTKGATAHRGRPGSEGPAAKTERSAALFEMRRISGNHRFAALVAQRNIASQRLVDSAGRKAPQPSAGGSALSLQREGVDFKAAFDKAVSQPTTLAKVQKSYAGAWMDDRRLISQDDSLMTKARANLDGKDFLKLMTELGVQRTGGLVDFPTAKKTDEVIQDTLKDYVGKAVKAGRTVQGSVVVLDGEDWIKAYYHEFPNELPRGGPTDDEPRTNAFTTTKPPVNVIVLHKDRGNPGTPIHEGLHLYQNDTVLHKCGMAFNEGITELLTRRVTGPMGVVRNNYQGNLVAMQAVESVVGGEAVLAKAYFDGGLDALKKAFIAFRVGKGDKKSEAAASWTSLVAHFRKNEFAKAQALCG